MREFIFVTVAVGSLIASTPSWAGYVDATYSGTVLQVGTGGPASVVVGTPITFDVVYDPSKLVDYTANVNAGFHTAFPTAPLFTSYQTVSLADDPLASLTVTVGGITFTKFDGVNYGTPCGDTPLSMCNNPTSPTGGLGAGNLPDVEYINGAFAGVGNILINSQGYTIDPDPTAAIGLRAARGRAWRVHSPGDYDFPLSLGDADNPFATTFAAGDIDLSTLRITPVPEPAAWTLLLAGMVVSGALSRRRHRWP